MLRNVDFRQEIFLLREGRFRPIGARPPMAKNRMLAAVLECTPKVRQRNRGQFSERRTDVQKEPWCLQP